MITEVRRLGNRMRTLVVQEGVHSAVRHSAEKMIVFAEYPFQKRAFAGRQFAVHGVSYTYFVHHYNATWRSERCVEVPIAQAFLWAAHPGARVLEVGNVLSHYGLVTHEIVDKYERAAGVVNADILDHRPAQLYDRILAISTLEHVGHDEVPRDDEKAVRALHHLRTLLTAGGSMLVTCPIGQNPAVDEVVLSNGAGQKREAFLWLRKADHAWQELPRQEAVAVFRKRPVITPHAVVWVAEFQGS